jgi:hypothetical protein
MKNVIRINYIHRTPAKSTWGYSASLFFWKEGPLLPRLLSPNQQLT